MPKPNDDRRKDGKPRLKLNRFFAKKSSWEEPNHLGWESFLSYCEFVRATPSEDLWRDYKRGFDSEVPAGVVGTQPPAES